MKSLEPIFEAISEIDDDSTVPKNVKLKLDDIANNLKGEGDASMLINQALDRIEDIAADTNIQPYVRTQLWNIISLLENALSS